MKIGKVIKDTNGFPVGTVGIVNDEEGTLFAHREWYHHGLGISAKLVHPIRALVWKLLHRSEVKSYRRKYGG